VLLLHVSIELLLSVERLAAFLTLVHAFFTALPHLLHGVLPSSGGGIPHPPSRALPVARTLKRREGTGWVSLSLTARNQASEHIYRYLLRKSPSLGVRTFFIAGPRLSSYGARP